MIGPNSEITIVYLVDSATNPHPRFFMHSFRRSTLALIIAVTLGLNLTGCIGSKVTKENFDKLETGLTGMNAQKIKEVMGEPTEQNSGAIGLAGVGVSGRSMTWKDGNRSISIVFINDQAISKSQIGM